VCIEWWFARKELSRRIEATPENAGYSDINFKFVRRLGACSVSLARLSRRPIVQLLRELRVHKVDFWATLEARRSTQATLNTHAVFRHLRISNLGPRLRIASMSRRTFDCSATSLGSLGHEDLLKSVVSVCWNMFVQLRCYLLGQVSYCIVKMNLRGSMI
jgi:hypothetical protein